MWVYQIRGRDEAFPTNRCRMSVTYRVHFIVKEAHVVTRHLTLNSLNLRVDKLSDDKMIRNFAGALFRNIKGFVDDFERYDLECLFHDHRRNTDKRLLGRDVLKRLISTKQFRD